ncbi:MAG: oxygenase MpaB family protein [Mycobacteriales bacterium]|nr:oxygenase MpaB family protein [Mycobacteriales bacterium]
MNVEHSDSPDPGLYGPDSVTWRVHADPSMALAGLRALLLQAVHPLAMAGVAQHSDFRQDPWGRLFRTAEYVGITTYGTTEQARRAGGRVRGIHRKLGGIEPESGTAYRVDDPELLRWVHCCESESFLSTAVRCGLRLSRSEQDAYYLEQSRGAELVGLRAEDVPRSVGETADYFTGMQPQLRVTSEARRAATFVLWPPMPTKVQVGTPARPAWIALTATAGAMLPRWARRLYRLPGLPTTDAAATAAGLAFRSGLLVVPESLRHGPHLKHGQRRMGLLG